VGKKKLVSKPFFHFCFFFFFFSSAREKSSGFLFVFRRQLLSRSLSDVEKHAAPPGSRRWRRRRWRRRSSNSEARVSFERRDRWSLIVETRFFTLLSISMLVLPPSPPLCTFI